MSAQLDDFCAWAQPCNGTYLNEQAFNALDVWQAAQAAMPVDKDAARYRWLREHTSGERDSRGRAEFDMPCPSPIGNIMQGSVAQHLDKAIDAEIARTGGAA